MHNIICMNIPVRTHRYAYISTDMATTSLIGYNMATPLVPYDANVWWCKILMDVVISDFDEKNFDKFFCLRVKHAIQ